MLNGPASVAATDDVSHDQSAKRVDDLIVEIVSDSGEGAQKAGQTLWRSESLRRWATVCGRWEIIPAEIKPPARSRAGCERDPRARGVRGPVTNMGDCADLVVAFNEQVLFGRIEQRVPQGHRHPAGEQVGEQRHRQDPAWPSTPQAVQPEFASQGLRSCTSCR